MLAKFTRSPLAACARARSLHTPALTTLTAISGVDGRYGDKTHDLRPYFSEHGLIKARTEVEVAWLRFMANHPVRCAYFYYVHTNGNVI